MSSENSDDYDEIVEPFDQNIWQTLNPPFWNSLSAEQQNTIEGLRHEADKMFEEMSIKVQPGNNNNFTKLFLELRLQYITVSLTVIDAEIKALEDIYKADKINPMAYENGIYLLSKRRLEVSHEESELHIYRASLHEELFDIIAGTLGTPMLDIYKAARYSRRAGKPKISYEKFKEVVFKFYDATRDHFDHYCVLTEQWNSEFDWSGVTPIVPISFRGAALNYLLGEPEENLATGRNGIPIMNSYIESPFNYGQITIVPASEDQPLDQPSKWSIIVLDERLMETPVSVNYHTDMGILWKDLDGKNLKFLTSNRPARRYLYFRYFMTYINAINTKKKYALSKLNNVPSKLWATPARKSGYLRKSVLEAMHLNTKIPSNLLDGYCTFEDNRSDKWMDKWCAGSLLKMVKVYREKLGDLYEDRRYEAYDSD